MTKFNFLIKQNIKDAWKVLKSNFWVFFVLTLLIFIISSLNTEDSFVFSAIVSIVSIAAGYMFISLSLAAADNKSELLKFKTIQKHLPNVKDFFYVLFIGLLTSVFIFIPIVVGLIPWGILNLVANITSGTFLSILSSVLLGIGAAFILVSVIYIGIRLNFAALSYVDKRLGIIKSLKYSWNLVGHDVFWKVFLVMLTTIGIFILGILALGIGVLVAYPLVLIVLARLYRALDAFRNGETVVLESSHDADMVQAEEGSEIADTVEIEEEEVIIEVNEIEDGDQTQK